MKNNSQSSHTKPRQPLKKSLLNTCNLSHYLQNSDLPSFLTALPTFISTTLHTSFSLTPSFHSTFLTTLSTLSEPAIKHLSFLLKHITKSKHKLIKHNFLLSTRSFPFTELILFILSFLHNIQTTTTTIVEFADKKSIQLLQRDINEYIAKLFQSELLTLSDVELLINFIYVINDNATSIKNTIEKGITPSFNLFLLILTKLNKTNVDVALKQQFISNYVTLLYNKANSNLNFLYALSKTTQLFKLLNVISDNETSKNEIITLLTFIYAFKLRQTHLSNIYKGMKASIANVNDVQVDKFVSLLKLITNQIHFFMELHKKEQQHEMKCGIESGFVFNNDTNADKLEKVGFTYGPITFKESKPVMSVMFTFQPFDTTSDECRTVFSVRHNRTQVMLLVVYQHKSNLYIKQFNNAQDGNSNSEDTPFTPHGVVIGKDLQCNEMYFVVLSCKSSLIGKKRSLFCYISNAKGKKEIPFTLDLSINNKDKDKDNAVIDIDIGYYYSSNNSNKHRYVYYGIIGAIEIFNNTIDPKFCESLDKNILLYKHFITNSTDKQTDNEINTYYSCSTTEHPNMVYIRDQISFFRLTDTLVSVISPLTVLNPIHKDKRLIPNYTYYNTTNTTANFAFKVVPIPENGFTFPFTKTFHFVDTFTQNEGIDYVIMCIELIHHMHLNVVVAAQQQHSALSAVYVNIYTVLERVFEFVCELLQHETYTELSKEKYARVFYSCSKLIFKVSSYVILCLYM